MGELSSKLINATSNSRKVIHTTLIEHTHSIGFTSSGVISNIRGFRYTLTSDDIPILINAKGTPAILALNLRALRSLRYSSNDIFL